MRVNAEQVAAIQESVGVDPSGWTMPTWTIEGDMQLCKDIDVQTSILSITAPGACVVADPTAQAKLARKLNEEGARIRDAHPSSYGFFVSLPDVLNTKAALEELAYGLDVLKADGVTLFTRYGEDNHYLGHPDIRPIWEELNRRKAVVFVHPTHSVDVHLVNSHLPQPMFDYPHETGRASIDMILQGTMSLVKDCRIILSHAGGTLPWLIDRVGGMIPYTPFTIGLSSEQIAEQASQFYFDTALSSDPSMLDMLLKIAKPGHVLFGSDFPYAPTEGIKYFTKRLDEHLEATRSIDDMRSAGLDLFPRLRK